MSAYTPFDYDLVARYVAYIGKLISTPNILTEVSNLAGKLRQDVLAQFRTTLASKLEIVDETYVPSKVARRDQHFTKLGLTDAAIISLALERKCVVLTADLPLYHVLWHRGAEAINFNHLRQFAGEFD